MEPQAVFPEEPVKLPSLSHAGAARKAAWM
jgi:hypothetical protein